MWPLKMKMVNYFTAESGTQFIIIIISILNMQLEIRLGPDIPLLNKRNITAMSLNHIMMLVKTLAAHL